MQYLIASWMNVLRIRWIMLILSDNDDFDLLFTSPPYFKTERYNEGGDDATDRDERDGTPQICPEAVRVSRGDAAILALPVLVQDVLLRSSIDADANGHEFDAKLLRDRRCRRVEYLVSDQ